MRCYQKVATHYPPDSYLINLLPMAMRMAGPGEAILHMIIARNYGCTHFVIVHQHASPGNDCNNAPFYQFEKTEELARNAAQEPGVATITFDERVFLPFDDEYKIASQVPAKVDTITLTGTDIQKRIRAGKKVPEWATFPEVLQELRKSFPPP